MSQILKVLDEWPLGKKLLYYYFHIFQNVSCFLVEAFLEFLHYRLEKWFCVFLFENFVFPQPYTNTFENWYFGLCLKIWLWFDLTP